MTVLIHTIRIRYSLLTMRCRRRLGHQNDDSTCGPLTFGFLPPPSSSSTTDPSGRYTATIPRLMHRTRATRSLSLCYSPPPMVTTGARARVRFPPSANSFLHLPCAVREHLLNNRPSPELRHLFS